MPQGLKIDATVRGEFGKGATRRLRRGGRVPAVIYGGSGETLNVSLDPRQLAPVLHTEAGHTSVLTMEIPGTGTTRAMLRDWQMDPVHGSVLHVDFIRVTKDTRVRVRVPIHVTGEPQGVKLQGGIFEFVLREVEVECLPDDIPENITVDVTDLMIGRNIRVGHLPVKDNVNILSDPDRVVAHVVALKAEEEKPAEEVAEAAPAEPEVIRKGKAEEGAEETKGEEKGAKS